MIEINGWRILSTKVFNHLYKKLVMHVSKLSKNDPDNYKSHPKTKLLASIQRAIKVDVPANPNDKSFRLGKTLGSKYTHWRRVKNNMPPRYRMFFRFHSKFFERKDKERANWIIFAWFNDELTLRKEGAKNDVYRVFKSFLEKNKIPDDFQELLKDAHANELKILSKSPNKPVNWTP